MILSQLKISFCWIFILERLRGFQSVFWEILRLSYFLLFSFLINIVMLCPGHICTPKESELSAMLSIVYI